MKAKITLLVSFLAFTSIFSQVKEKEIFSRDKNGKPNFVKLNETTISDEVQTVESFLKTVYEADNSIDFKYIENSTINDSGLKSEKLQQFYKGLKVQFGIINTVFNNGRLKVFNGQYLPIKDLNVNPKISEKSALNFALNHVGADKYIWEDPAYEEMIKMKEKNSDATNYPKGELVVIDKDYSFEESNPTLAYKFDIYAINPISRNHYYVDASSGEIILVDALLKHVGGPADTRYSGQRTIETEQVGSEYILNDVTRGNGIHTLDMNNGSNYTNASDLSDNNNNWTNSEYNNTNNKNALLDAHWGAIKTYDYFYNKHNRNSINNNGYELENYVNADLTGLGYINSDNAFWDGSKMTYGIGTTLNPLVSIDIIGHEIGHGLDQFTSNLTYNRESGAIDEGLSDVWGAMVEFYAEPSKSTYSLGEDIGFTIRSMSNPKSHSQPDTYGGTYWSNPNCGTPSNANDYCGVHTNSGVFNHWFYLLAEGSSSTDEINDNNDTFSIQGIGKEKAAKIVYRVQTTYFTSSTNFQQARAFTIQAAEDLYGANSTESVTVCGSWYAVGVGNNNCQTNAEISGDDTICYNVSKTYNLSNANAVSWQTSWNLQLISSTSSSITVKPFNDPAISGAGYVEANLGVGSIRKDIWVGKPSVDYIDFANGIGGSYFWCSSHTGNTYEISPKLSGSTYQMRLRKYPSLQIVYSPSTNYSGNTGTFNYTPTPGWYVFEVRRTNSCGTSDWFGFEVEFVDCTTGGGGEGEYFVSPNPTSNILNIKKLNKNSNAEKQNINNQNSFYKLYSFNSNLVLEGKIDDKSINIDISSFKKGRYILRIISGEKSEVHHLIFE
ncbi:M4 family metallopeptidase [Aureibaculum sp. 2210JD6-5]|uniref:M4 family metallopeptidase n=1 Tax=Aureibaculum sp. 2210JD6-5 TaxID=3103957 RepID=UPI002AACC1A1|nr:M4 family metallopeptidase [Aureibaculum sp. 2210JD6-5]MDY7396330.1 M4 family metallopeptidase [Aureibaculum sp. 2210JD6-5]